MKKILIAAMFLASSFVVEKASAGIVRGTLSETMVPGGIFVDCNGSGYCGLVGQANNGRWYFIAASGNIYWMTSAEDPTKPLENGDKVQVEPVGDEWEG